jgi:hypothetical protein
VKGQETQTVRLVLPPVWPGVFRHTEQLFRKTFQGLGLTVEAVGLVASRAAALNVVLGWSLFEPEVPPGTRYVIHQSEPLSIDPWPERVTARRALFDGAAKIWEYSEVKSAALPSRPGAVGCRSATSPPCAGQRRGRGRHGTSCSPATSACAGGRFSSGSPIDVP